MYLIPCYHINYKLTVKHNVHDNKIGNSKLSLTKQIGSSEYYTYFSFFTINANRSDASSKCRKSGGQLPEPTTAQFPKFRKLLRSKGICYFILLLAS